MIKSRGLRSATQNNTQEVQRLDAVLQKCLAKDCAQRSASVVEPQRELIPAIEQYLPLATSAFAHSQDQTIIDPLGGDKSFTDPVDGQKTSLYEEI